MLIGVDGRMIVRVARAFATFPHLLTPLAHLDLLQPLPQLLPLLFPDFPSASPERSCAHADDVARLLP